MVHSGQETLSDAAKLLNLKYTSAKSIYKVFVETGRVEKMNRAKGFQPQLRENLGLVP